MSTSVDSISGSRTIILFFGQPIQQRLQQLQIRSGSPIHKMRQNTQLVNYSLPQQLKNTYKPSSSNNQPTQPKNTNLIQMVCLNERPRKRRHGTLSQQLRLFSPMIEIKSPKKQCVDYFEDDYIPIAQILQNEQIESLSDSF